MPKRIAYKILIAILAATYIGAVLAIVRDIPPDDVGQPE